MDNPKAAQRSGRRFRIAAARSVPALVLMGSIFYLSAQSDLDSGLGVIDDVGRKFVHAGTYALLAFLLARAVHPLGFDPRRELAIAAGLALLYAISDEWHQSFVDGRIGSPIDVAIDGLGIAGFVATSWRWAALRAAVGLPLTELGRIRKESSPRG